MLAIIASIEDAFEREFISEIYIKYHRLMHAKAYSVVHDEFEAEEIVQESFVKLIERIDVLMNLDRDKIPVYVIVTAKNTAIKHWYKSKNQPKADDDFDSKESLAEWSADEAALPEELYIRKEEHAKLSETIGKLSERDCILLESKYILMLSDDEIAETLHIAPSSVRACLTRARRRAYAILKGEMENV